jgi:putative ABC transport system permease protein
MGWMRRLRSTLFDQGVVDEFHAEARAYFDELVREGIRNGAARERAERDAQDRMGNLALAQDQTRDADTLRWLDDLIRDVRLATRQLRRTRGFAVVAILMLTLGIGASLAVFSVADILLLRPLPFRDAANLFALWERPPRTARWKRQTVPYALYLEWKRNLNTFEEISGFAGRDVTLVADGRPQLVRGDIVSANFFSLLGANAAAGRTILPTDADGTSIVVLSDALWREQFSSSPAIVGQTVVLNGIAHTVVGVMSPESQLPVLDQPPVLWTLLKPDDPELSQQAGRLAVVGRLRKGSNVSLVESELVAIQSTFQTQQAAGQRADGVIVQALQQDRAEALRPTLLLVAGAIAAFLLIACANVGGLWLGRLLQRTREMAVRASLGASRGRLIRQLTAEITLLWSLGGILGVVLGALAVKWLDIRRPFGPEEFPAQAHLAIDSRGILFALVVTLVTALLFGVLSAFQGSRLNLSDALKSGGRGSSSTRSTHSWRNLLVTAEMATSVLLLAGAALLVTSLERLGSQPLGFETDHILIFKLQLPQREYASDPQRINFQRSLLARLRTLPGVDRAGATSARPLGGIVAAPVTVEGSTQSVDGPPPWSGQQAVDADYFHAMGITVLRGRPFEETDSEQSEPVVVINQTFARKYFPGKDPIGQRLKHGTVTQNRPSMRVVGLVNDVKHAGLEWDFLPETFVPFAQLSGAYARVIAKDINVVIRGRADLATIRQVVWSMDPQLPVFDVRSAEDLVSASADRPKFRTSVVSAFAIIALLLASVGLYGVLAQAVLQRQQEFGIRIALGARPTDVIRQVLYQGISLAGIGAACGVVATLALGRIVGTVLYGVRADDFRILTGVVTTMLLVATMASLVPATRATTSDPLVALRGD